MEKLTKDQIETLHTALLQAFPTRDVLAKLVYSSLQENLAAITTSSSEQQIVLDLITWAMRSDSLEHLLQAALAAKPDNRTLQQVAAQLGMVRAPVNPLNDLFDYLHALSDSAAGARFDPINDLLQQLQRAWQRQLEDEATTLDQIRARLAAAKAGYSRLDSAHTKLQTDHDQLQANHRQLEADLVAARARITELEVAPATAALEADLRTARARIAELEASRPVAADPPPTPADPAYPDRLTPAQYRAGHAILLAAFTKRTDLALLTRQYLDVPLNSISSDTDLRSVITELLDWVEANGRLPDLLAGVAEERATNKQVQTWLAGLRDEIHVKS